MANVDVLSQLYNVGAIFAGPSISSGFMFSSGNSGVNLINQIPRAQNAGITYSISRQDVNQLGQLARVDNIITDAPTAQLNMSYYVVDGRAEKSLGFAVDNLTTSIVSGFLDRTTADRNYFLEIAKEGSDAIGSIDSGNNNVVALGNGYISNYSLSAAVGQIPTATVTVDAMNFQTYTGTYNQTSPAIDFNTDTVVSGPRFSLPVAISYTGAAIPSALRPSEVILEIERDSAIGDYSSGVGKINISSYSLSLPINTQTIPALGAFYGRGKKLNPPIPFTISIDALAADVAPGSIADLRCNDSVKTMTLKLKEPGCSATGANALIIQAKGIKLTSRDYSLGIGSAATVRLSFDGQVGGIGDTSRGLFMSGNYATKTGL
jgi:hypothetical protein